MIASYLHNFIFIKTKKTAGTTVELTLGPICGPDDIVTPLNGMREEELRSNGRPICRNFMADPKAEERLLRLMMRKDHPALKKRRRLLERATYYQHMTAQAAKQNLPAEFWQRAHKFTVERHPYERVVSKAYFKYKEDQPFDQFLDSIVREGRYTSHQFYMIDGEIAVDEIIRQENLHGDLKRLGAKLGFPVPDELARAKGITRTDRRPAHEILTEEQKKIIYETCRKEFEILQYEP
jgi:hypothetical protein